MLQQKARSFYVLLRQCVASGLSTRAYDDVFAPNANFSVTARRAICICKRRFRAKTTRVDGESSGSRSVALIKIVRITSYASGDFSRAMD